MRIYLFLFGLLFLVSCASHRGVSVLERADDLKARPDWASITKPSWMENGNHYFLGYVEVSGDASTSAALNMSDEKAMAEPLRALVENYLEQNQVGEELRLETAIGQRIISATKGYRPPMPGLKITKRYWETIRIPQGDDPNQVRLELRAYALAELPHSDYEKAKEEYFNRLNGQPRIAEILEEVGQKQLDQVLNNE